MESKEVFNDINAQFKTIGFHHKKDQINSTKSSLINTSITNKHLVNYHMNISEVFLDQEKDI